MSWLLVRPSSAAKVQLRWSMKLTTKLVQNPAVVENHSGSSNTWKQSASTP
ncbi:hypothetical protein D9M70_592140 [compost metagenome]